MAHRLLVPAVSAAAVLAIVAGGAVVAGRDGDRPRGDVSRTTTAPVGSPTLPALQIGSGDNRAVPALGAPEGGTGKIAAPQAGAQAVVIKGELPAATDTPVPAYRLARRTVTAAEVAKLAAALGLKGEAQAVSGSWQLIAGAKYLTVDPTPTLDWRMMPGGPACAGGPDSPVSVEGSAGDAGTGGADSAASSPAYDPANPEVAGGPATTPIPGACGGVSSSAVSCAPEGAMTLVACPTPTPLPVASDDAAKAAVSALLGKLGVDALPADMRLDAGYDGVRHVSVRRRLEGRPVEGMSWEFGIDVTGAVVTASGQLAEPVVAGEYPMLPPADLAQGLTSSRMRIMLCEQKPGVEGCAPPPPVVVTGASAGLSLAFPSDYEKGEAYLLPSWLFTIEGDPAPTAVVAVPKQYLPDPAPDATGKDPGTIEPAPMPPDTVVEPAPGVDPTETAGTAAGGGTSSHGGRPFPLPTSDWKAGDVSMAALLSGQLQMTAHGCVEVVKEGVAYPPAIIWPAGYSATVEGDDVVVRNAGGEVVARTGEPFSAGGGFLGKNATKCGSEETFVINDAGPYND